MQRGTILNEKLLQFPVGSFLGSHAELPLRAGPSPAAGLGRQQSSGERGCARPPAPPGCWDMSRPCPAPPVPLQHLGTLHREHRARAALRAPGWGHLPPSQMHTLL